MAIADVLDYLHHRRSVAKVPDELPVKEMLQRLKPVIEGRLNDEDWKFLEAFDRLSQDQQAIMEYLLLNIRKAAIED